MPAVREEQRDHDHVEWTKEENDREEQSVSWHGRRQRADHVRTHKLWPSLWVAEGTIGAF